MNSYRLDNKTDQELKSRIAMLRQFAYEMAHYFDSSEIDAALEEAEALSVRADIPLWLENDYTQEGIFIMGEPETPEQRRSA